MFVDLDMDTALCLKSLKDNLDFVTDDIVHKLAIERAMEAAYELGRIRGLQDALNTAKLMKDDGSADEKRPQ